MNNLKNKTITGIFWSSIERFSAQGVQFALGIILARLLTPKDYGLVGMIGIFIAISKSFVMSGFGAALIQKINRDEKDFSTTFYYNLTVSVLFYFILFFSAPYIANFYGEPLLVNLTRAISLSIIIEAFAVVQNAKFVIKVDFKSQTKASVSSVIISGTLGILLAYKGFGVWALVIQSLTKSCINVGVLWYMSKWVPRGKFYWNRFKGLFSYGSKLLISGLFHAFAQNLNKIIIGKTFSPEALGLYSRANSLALFPSQNIEEIVSRVTFPILCEFQNDKEKLEKIFEKIIKSTAILIFPLMILLVVLAEPLIITLLTEKWQNSILLMQIACIGYLFLPINSINVQIFGVVGKTDWILKADLVKQLLLIGFLLGTFPFGIRAIVLGQSAAYILTYFVNLIFIQKVINYKLINQLIYLFPILVFSIILGVVVYLVNIFNLSPSLKLYMGSGIGALFYILIVWKLDIAEMRTTFFNYLKSTNN